ncbi:efflux transporter outer membrane subunit [uncultured Azohydromonas sp.]|uniref:efflux transporter outer membrane subunit n=1 Tax=uncultured Azohydromonas sp. TaxID=487342 RepID=UPI0026190869|nr:TolC family protein [uncultured Azohydromonas sp.]
MTRSVWPLRLSVAGIALLLAACASGPPPEPALPPLPTAFANVPEDGQPGGEPAAAFWRGFQDPQLDALVTRALEANFDLRIAVARLREARALARLADASLLPQVNGTAGVGRVRDFIGPDNALAPGQTFYSVGLDVRWEADLFGRLSAERRAAQAQVRAGEADTQALQLSLSAEVARGYFELRGLQERLRVSRAALQTQEAVLRLVQARQDVGRGTGLDTERARALVQSTAAGVPVLEAALQRTRYRLAVLCGLPPTALDAELEAQRPLPGLRSVALGGIGAPESLLRRRPDIRAAELDVAAAAARVGVARADLFPRITLGGTLGHNASRVGDLGDGSTYVYNLGAQLLWNLLDFGRVRAQIAAADARSEAALRVYEATVLAALEETEGALASYTHTQQQAQHLFDAARAAEAAAAIARGRFEVGVIDFLAVLDAEREQLAARDQLAQSQAGAAVALVAVYKALAGGWGPAPEPSSAPSATSGAVGPGSVASGSRLPLQATR